MAHTPEVRMAKRQAKTKASKLNVGKKTAPRKSGTKMAKTISKKAKSLAPAPRSGFLWKVLEEKQKALEMTQGQGKHPFAHLESERSQQMQKGHGRFAGPRRRAA